MGVEERGWRAAHVCGNLLGAEKSTTNDGETGKTLPIADLMEHLDGCMGNTAVASMTSNKMLQQLINTNAKQQMWSDKIINKLKAARTTGKP